MSENLFSIAVLFALSGIAQLGVVWKGFPTWLAYLLSVVFSVAFYGYATGWPASWAYSNISAWGSGYIAWFITTAAGHLIADRIGFKANSLGGSNATQPPVVVGVTVGAAAVAPAGPAAPGAGG